MISSLIRFLIDPLTIFTGLVILGMVFYLKQEKYGNFGRNIWIGSALWFYVISTPFVPNMLLESLENRYKPILTVSEEDPANYRGADIVILGGGHGFDNRLPSNSVLSRQALMRLAEGIRLFRMIPESRLVFSGYSSSDRKTHAEVLAETAMVLGADLSERSRYALMMEPSDTWEESGAYHKLAEAEMEEPEHTARSPLIVVTSAAHMPRAMAMFRERGLNPVASPADYRVKTDPKDVVNFNLYHFFPSNEPIGKMKYAVKEYTGLAEYYLFLRNIEL